MSIRLELATDEVACFRREGYTLIRGLLSDPELACLRDDFDNLGAAKDHVVDTFGKTLVATRNLWRHSPELELLIQRIAPSAAQLMAVDQVRLFGDVALVKPPTKDGGQPTGWHQDSPIHPFDRRGFLTIWIAVDDVPLEQGPLTFLPGSHRLGLLGVLDGAAEGVQLDSLLKDEDWAYVGDTATTALEAGDATVHDGYLLHCASANVSERPRRAWAVRFIPADTLYTGAAHAAVDDLGLEPFKPFEHENFPLFPPTA